MTRRKLAGALETAANADVALLGVDTLTENALYVYSRTREPNSLSEILSRAVGLVACHFLDAQGRAVCTELEQRVVGLSLNQMARIPCVIGIAGGTAKQAIIRAALGARVISALVTDEATAEALIGRTQREE